MKPKATGNTRGRAPKAKIVKKELPSEELINLAAQAYQLQPQLKPSVEIQTCISFQKFRYSGENRPGKKYQEKEFMTLKLNHLQDKVVRVVIICTDADNRELIHPNGLVGKDCHDGIYDKEYAVTKPFFLIKIPYLRTERIKTKKNEHEKIQSVLSQRASHLPSPYRERCLSQCTDKYTSSRKFDTTKVCFGVIVTVLSHQGYFNGSLHAISHVVRSASEKTALSILKLSSDTVPASGGVIDIFTTEDGPAIEPEKYEVYVTTDEDAAAGLGAAESEKFYPGRGDILYKRVITYRVPPFYPNPHLTSQVQATLHLECPQSNQFCEFNFTYTPEGQIVVLDEQAFTEKRSYIGDLKPSAERLREEIFGSDRGTESVKAGLKSKLSVKAGLKTKLQSRQDPQGSSGSMYVDAQNDSQDGISHQDIIIHTEGTRMTGFSRENSVIIRHQDPNTGETYHLLDMDASKSNGTTGSGGPGLADGENQHYSKGTPNNFLGIKGVRGKGSSFRSHAQDVEVVATGYSDAVPPNTTVLIYTTKDGTAYDTTTGEEVVIQMPEENQEMIRHAQAARHGGKQISVLGGAYAAATQNGPSEQVIRREAMREVPRIVVSQSSPQYAGETTLVDNQRVVSQSFSDHTVQASASDSRHSAARVSYSSTDINSSPSVSNSVADHYSPIPTSSPSAIPDLRRMLIPNKTIPSASPWEVETQEEDSSSEYLLVKDYPYGPAGKQVAISQAVAVKKEPVDGATIIQTSSSSHVHHRYPVAEKQLHRLEENGYNQESARRVEASVSMSEDTTATGKENVITSSTMQLGSMDLSNMLADNLPTMKVFEIAENLEKGLPSTTEGEGMETN